MTKNDSSVVTAVIHKAKGQVVGLDFRQRKDGSIFIKGITPDGLASQTALQPNMKLLKINSVDCTVPTITMEAIGLLLMVTQGTLTIVAQPLTAPTADNLDLKQRRKSDSIILTTLPPESLVTAVLHKQDKQDLVGLGIRAIRGKNTITSIKKKSLAQDSKLKVGMILRHISTDNALVDCHTKTPIQIDAVLARSTGTLTILAQVDKTLGDKKPTASHDKQAAPDTAKFRSSTTSAMEHPRKKKKRKSSKQLRKTKSEAAIHGTKGKPEFDWVQHGQSLNRLRMDTTTTDHTVSPSLQELTTTKNEREVVEVEQTAPATNNITTSENELAANNSSVATASSGKKLSTSSSGSNAAKKVSLARTTSQTNSTTTTTSQNAPAAIPPTRSNTSQNNNELPVAHATSVKKSKTIYEPGTLVTAVLNKTDRSEVVGLNIRGVSPGKTIISSIPEGTLASNSCLQKGMILKMIDNVDCSRKSPEEIVALLRNATGRIVITAKVQAGNAPTGNRPTFAPGTLVTVVLHKTDISDAVGLNIRGIGPERTIISSIRNDTLAYNSCLQKGMILKRINEVDCSKKSPEEIGALLRNATGRIEIWAQVPGRHVQIGSPTTAGGRKTTRPPPPGIPAGGVWNKHKFAGPATFLVCALGCLLFGIVGPLLLVCGPYDEEDVYTVNGRTYTADGRLF